MQTTLSLWRFTPGWMYFGHVGDCRIYNLPKRKKEIKLLTHDDTHVGWLFRNGKINEHEARPHRAAMCFNACLVAQTSSSSRKSAW
jgi:serine/threonine protein phosphatase PrpC